MERRCCQIGNGGCLTRQLPPAVRLRIIAAEKIDGAAEEGELPGRFRCVSLVQRFFGQPRDSSQHVSRSIQRAEMAHPPHRSDDDQNHPQHHYSQGSQQLPTHAV